MLAAGRVITGYPILTPKHVVRAEAGIVPVAARRGALAAPLLALPAAGGSAACCR